MILSQSGPTSNSPTPVSCFFSDKVVEVEVNQVVLYWVKGKGGGVLVVCRQTPLQFVQPVKDLVNNKKKQTLKNHFL